jgi:hypothetical protein
VDSHSSYSKPLKAFVNARISRLKDFAFELRLEDFVFRWETNLAGYKISAEVISTQIIVPLMSTAHLAFNSPNPVGGMSESDLETVGEVKPSDYDSASTDPRWTAPVHRL